MTSEGEKVSARRRVAKVKALFSVCFVLFVVFIGSNLSVGNKHTQKDNLARRSLKAVPRVPAGSSESVELMPSNNNNNINNNNKNNEKNDNDKDSKLNKNRKRRKLTSKKSMYYSSYPSFSFPYQQYYGAYNWMGMTGYGGGYSAYPNSGGAPFYQRPAVPYGGQMTSPIFNYGYEQMYNQQTANMNMGQVTVPTQVTIPQILTMPSVGSALGYGRSTFIQQPEIGGSGTQNGQSGPGRGGGGLGLSDIINDLVSEGGLLDPTFLGSLANLFLDGNMENLAMGALDILTRLSQGEGVDSLLRDLTDIVFSGFMNGIMPNGEESNDDNQNEINDQNDSEGNNIIGGLIDVVGNLDLSQLDNIQLPLSPPSIISPNILDAVLERFGMEAELGSPEVYERAAKSQYFKSEPIPPITETLDGQKIALVTLKDILSHFSPSEKLNVAKLRTVLFMKYQISNPETAGEYIQFVLKNEIPVIGAHIPGAPAYPTPMQFYAFAGKKGGQLTFRDVYEILELFYDIHEVSAAETVAVALERLGVDVLGFNHKATYTNNERETLDERSHGLYEGGYAKYTHTKDTMYAPEQRTVTLELESPKKTKSRIAYGPSKPSKQQFLALFPHPTHITTHDIREVLKFYYNVFDEETVTYVQNHMTRRWHVNVD